MQTENFLLLSFLESFRGEEGGNWNEKGAPVVYRTRGRIGF